MSETELLFYGLLVLLLLLFSAFFSCSETALTAVSRARIYTRIKEGDKRARQVAQLREKKERLIGTILLGNNAVNIGASALSTAIAMELFGINGVAYATGVMTFVVLILSEVLPKTYALHHAEKTALRVAPIYIVLIRLFKPITALVEWAVMRLLKLFRLDKATDGLNPLEAIRGAIELHHSQGEVEKLDRDMLGSILDLDELTVEDVMVHRRKMITADIDQPLEKTLKMGLRHGFSRIPLWQENGDNIVGVLHMKDVLKALHANDFQPDQLSCRRLMRKAWFIPTTSSLKDQLHAFRQQRNHLALVVDEYGSLEGMVTLEDILEEIVGQIDDEHDPASAAIHQDRDGGVVVAGATTIRDLNRQYDWQLPDDDAATIAGLLIHEMREIPLEGAEFETHGFRFKVLQKQKNQLTRLKITPLQPDTSGDDESSA